MNNHFEKKIISYNPNYSRMKWKLFTDLQNFEIKFI
jgi:hypothetical protein